MAQSCNMKEIPQRESWGSKLGVILAVAGSAVGLGNFLRFPGVVAENGGGAFMVPYFLAFLFLGIPVCWAEWIMGRRAGRLSGLASAPGLFGVLTKGSKLRYFGALGLWVPVIIYFFYVYVESWCLAYAWFALTGKLSLQGQGAGAYEAFFNEFTGDPSVTSSLYFPGGIKTSFVFFLITFFVNFIFIYRGISKGIERFCRIAMPMLIVMAMIIVVRVITLGANPDHPEQNFITGLGFMWNPDWSRLGEPKVWIAACGQIFFSLSVGFGIIVTYASYLKKDDDVVLSGLTASATNEFCEVCLGGLMVIPAAMIFLGTTQMANVAGQSTFSIGFVTMPYIFDMMPMGQMFAVLLFFLLFLAGVTSSLSMLQPAIAFFEEGFGLNRRASVTFLSLLTFLGSTAVILAPGLSALGTLDRYSGNFGIPLLALFEVFIFVFVLKVSKGIREAEHGADMRLPKIFGFVITYITPLFLLIILGWAIYGEVMDRMADDYIPMSNAESITFVLMFVFLAFLGLLQKLAWPRMKRRHQAYKKAMEGTELD